MPTESLVVSPVGSKLLVGNRLEVLVISILIEDPTSIKYEIAWWVEGDRKTAWIRESEILEGAPSSLEIGFNS